MSMPIFPEDGVNITKEQAFNMLLGSIAMEELGLSHIINAEGEKLQYVLGTLPDSTPIKVTPKELLEVNQSVTTLLEQVAQNQFLLKGKLAQVLSAQEKWDCTSCLPHCNCPSHCENKNVQKRIFCEGRGGVLCEGQHMVWKEITNCGENCSDCELSTIPICQNHKEKTILNFNFELFSMDNQQVTIAFFYSGCCINIPIIKSSGYSLKNNSPIYISGSTVLTPPPNDIQVSGIICTLCEPQKVNIKKANVTLTTF